ncbi:hypothetical protein LINPERHAP1_LOCUS24859 [Linum perenne]
MEEQQVQHIGETVSGKGKRKGPAIFFAVEVIDPADEDNPDKISKSCTMCSEKYRTPILHPDGHYMFGEFDDIFYNSTQDDVDDDDGIF